MSGWSCWGKQRCPSCQHHHETNFCGTCYLSGSLYCNCHLASAKKCSFNNRNKVYIHATWFTMAPHHSPPFGRCYPSIESKINGSLEIREGRTKKMTFQSRWWCEHTLKILVKLDDFLNRYTVNCFKKRLETTIQIMYTYLRIRFQVYQIYVS